MGGQNILLCNIVPDLGSILHSTQTEKVIKTCQKVLLGNIAKTSEIASKQGS